MSLKDTIIIPVISVKRYKKEVRSIQEDYEKAFQLKKLEIDVEKNIYKVNGIEIDNATEITIWITADKVKVRINREILDLFLHKKNVS